MQEGFMIQHSMIIDDFLPDPIAAREDMLKQEMMDYKASDNVVYPGIIELPRQVQSDIINGLVQCFGDRIQINPTLFARYSFETMTPPNWAHSARS
jgi:hypothetical protein